MNDFLIQPYGTPRQSEGQTPTFGESMAASRRTESGFAALYQALGERRYAPDPDFSLSETIGRRGDLLPYADSFRDVESEAELDAVWAQIKQEQKDRAVRASAGLTGFVTDTIASLVSPSTFIPIGAVGVGVRGVARIGGAVAGSVAFDEAILSATQETRTAGESVANIIGGALIGSALGGAVVGLTGAQRAALLGSVEAAGTIRVGPHPQTDLAGGSIGAASLRLELEDPGLPTGVLAPGAEAGLWAKAVDKTLRFNSKASTSLRNLVSDVPEARAVQAKLGDAGVPMAKADEGITVNPAGTIENRTKVLMQTREVKALEALELNYANYRYSVPKATKYQRNMAEVKGVLPRGGKLSRAQWEEQVFLEMQSPQAGQMPEVVKAAAELRKDFYDPFLKDAQDVGLLPAELTSEMGPSLNYLNHVFRKDAIIANPTLFDEMIIRQYQRMMEEGYLTQVEKATTKKATGEADIQDLARPLPEVVKIQEDIRAERELIAQTRAGEIRAERSEAKSELKRLRDMKAKGTNPARYVASDEIARLEKKIEELTQALDEDMMETLRRDNALRRRSQLLSRSIARLDERQGRALSRLEAVEEQGLKALRGVSSRARKFLDMMDGLTDEAYAKGIAELETDFNVAAGKLDELEEKITKINAENPEFETGPDVFAMRVQRFRRSVLPPGKLLIENEADRAVALGRIDEALTRDEWTPQQRQSLIDLRNDIASVKLMDAADIEKAFRKAWRLEEERYATTAKMSRTAELLEDAAQEGPEFARATLQDWYDDMLRDVQGRVARAQERSAKLAKRAESLDPEFARKRIRAIETKLLDTDDQLKEWLRVRGGEVLPDGKLNFAEAGKEHARALRQKIIGDPTRVIGVDLAAERGPELARVLDVPIEEKMKFLETSMDKLVRIYARNMAPDIELMRADFGVNGAKAIEKIEKGFQKKLDAAMADETLTPEAKQKAAEAIHKQREGVLRSVTGQVQRLRHQRGVPPDPDNYLYRGGRMVQQWNVLTMMGNVLASSLVDPVTVVAKFGLRRVFRDGIKAYVHGLKAVKMAQREARYAGMNELMLQDRFHQITDLMEDVGRRTTGEKAVDFLANKIGIVGMFSYWTQFMKEWATPMAAGRLLDAVEVQMTGRGHMSADKARSTLAQLRIDEDLAQRIWAQQGTGGLTRVGDLWIPNTESWTDRDAVDAFRAAILGDVEAAIVTPGLERPLFIDQSMVHRLAFQFQSFMWSSHAKILFPMMQKRDWAAMEAIIATIPMAMLSYYVDQVARGNDPTDEPVEKWIDEILARSPLIGVFAQAHRAADSFSTTRPYVNFSDEGAERRAATSGMGLIFGPTYTTVRRGLQVLNDIDDPTKSTGTAIKGLMPYNNVIWLRQMFDQAVENSGLPDERG